MATSSPHGLPTCLSQRGCASRDGNVPWAEFDSHYTDESRVGWLGWRPVHRTVCQRVYHSGAVLPVTATFRGLSSTVTTLTRVELGGLDGDQFTARFANVSIT